MKSLGHEFLRRLRGFSHEGEEETAEPVAETTLKRRLEAPSSRLCGLTDVGSQRLNNEDDFYLSPDGGLWIVADGMGGQAAGEIASRLTIDAIATIIQSRPHGEALDWCLDTGLQEAQRRVLDYASTNEECQGMGSAVAAAAIEGQRLHICHVGDVRCYLHRGGVLEQVTEDHSVVCQLIRAELLTPDAARFHPERGHLVQAVGLSQRFSPTLTSRDLLPGDIVLLCSDGLWELVSHDDIGSVLSSKGSMRQLATVLADRAVSAGGEDNITIVLYEHMSPSVATDGRVN